MRTLYLTGGQQRDKAQDRAEWHQYQKGMILRLDLETGSSEIVQEYVSPPEVCAEEEDPAILFKSGTLQDGKLYVCTQTEVLIYALPHFERVGYVSLPCFNDLHHVCPAPEDNLLIANTGLDMVAETTLRGEVLREWGVLDADPWARFSREVDYRKVVTTKPHRSHPNHVFRMGEDVWVTRFEQKDAVCLTRSASRIRIDVERPHDGVVRGDHVYFTTVDGRIIVASRGDSRIKEIIDLNEIYGAKQSLGWCRGLALDGRRAWVGFSRLRPTKFREYVSWVKHGFSRVGVYNTLPTRVSCFDLSKRKCMEEVCVETLGLNAIFGVLAGPE